MDCDIRGVLGATIRLALGGIILLAGGLKAWKRADTDPLLAVFRVTSTRLLIIAAVATSLGEVVLGVWLVTGVWVEYALLIAMVFLVSATVILLTAWLRGYTGSCNCFGAFDKHRIGLTHIARNALLLSATYIVWAQAVIGGCAREPLSALPRFVIPAALFLITSVGVIYVASTEAESLLRRVARKQEARGKRNG